MKKSVPREYFESIVVAVVLALFVRTWVFQAFKIPSGSMEDGLLIGDHLIVNKMEFAPGSAFEQALLPGTDVQRGDVIVFKSPEEPDRDLIKRVIGLPGDRVELRSKKIYINDTPLDEQRYVKPVAPSAPPAEGVQLDYGPVVVPQGQYFMMGDNRDNSRDGRYWGFLPKSYIKGRALFIYFSLQPGQGLPGGIRWNRILDPVR